MTPKKTKKIKKVKAWLVGYPECFTGENCLQYSAPYYSKTEAEKQCQKAGVFTFEEKVVPVTITYELPL